MDIISIPRMMNYITTRGGRATELGAVRNRLKPPELVSYSDTEGTEPYTARTETRMTEEFNATDVTPT